MDKSQDNKKSFCTRCFLPIESDDKVDIEGQSFHRFCSTCCICRTIPKSLKMFYGHIFCTDCFQSHVLTKFQGIDNGAPSNSWNQWDHQPTNAQGSNESKESAPESDNTEQPKRSICARCLQSVNDCDKVTLCEQSFHAQCAQCYLCHTVPVKNLKIYYGQVFCEECFHRHVLNQSQDNPTEFFNNCFEQWQKNAQFAHNMKEFMASSKDSAPFIFMMQGNQMPFCRCGTGPQEWFPNSEPKKSVTSAFSIQGSLDTYDFSYENRTDNISDVPESVIDLVNDEKSDVTAIEKIEKLTKYLNDRDSIEMSDDKKWKILEPLKKSMESDDCDSFYGFFDQQKPKINLKCPKCLWQCGLIYVHNDYLKENVDIKS